MADLVKLEKQGRVYILTMLGDGDHTLNAAMFEALIRALETVQNAEDAMALVTTNEGRFYCNGLDLKWVKDTNYDTAIQSKYNLSILLATLVNINVPTVAAICGHASAAGFLWALAHDYRYMRGDRGYLYMSEMDVKGRIPVGTMSLIRAKLSPKAFKDTVLLAKKQTASEAYNSGILDSVELNSAETLKSAIAWATQLSNRDLNRDFYRTMRLDMHPNVLKELVDGSTGPQDYSRHPVLAKL